MKRIPTFAAGMLTAAVIGGLGVGALAASGAVTFNASALQLNGQQISAKGENYILPSGQQVPASITYTDETGGGTTYLPVRRISELLGIEIGWDSTTGSVTVGEDATTPDTNFASIDYSKWSAEEEAAYQEFKGMWTLGNRSLTYNNEGISFLQYLKGQTEESMLKFILRLDWEVYTDSENKAEPYIITYYTNDGVLLWQDMCFPGQSKYMGVETYVLWTFRYDDVIKILTD